MYQLKKNKNKNKKKSAQGGWAAAACVPPRAAPQHTTMYTCTVPVYCYIGVL